MGLLTREVEVKLYARNINHYELLGYKIVKTKNSRGIFRVNKGSSLIVKIEDVPHNSRVFVDVECDNCKNKVRIKLFQYYRCIENNNGKYFCVKCIKSIYAIQKANKTKIKKGMSFKQWCINNNRLDVLNRWDYELNQCSPDEISYGTGKKYYFKCPIGIHQSELKNIKNFVNGRNDMKCTQCNSLGFKYPHVFKFWSDKNKKTPYDYSCRSGCLVWWKCKHGLHRDYKKTIDKAVSHNFRCPQCQYSKGEEAISKYLITNNILYESQKTFDNLIGVCGGLLSYDFFLPEYNLLIEYQGEQHEKYIKGFHKNKKAFINQQEHDRRKREYAINNNIKLLEIWYYDFDNIEQILDKELKLNHKLLA